MLTVHELARKGHFNIRDSQLSALCGYKHPVLVNWGGEEETQSWKWPRVQEGFFFSLEDSHDSRQTEAERPHPSWKAIFIPVWLHVLPRGTLIVSHSVEATKRQAFQNTQTITLFFFCTQLKIIASSGFQSAALCVLHSLKLFWWVNSRRGKIKDGCWAAGLFVPSGGFSDFSYSAIVLMWS